MKVEGPVWGFSFTSTNTLPAIMSNPQVSCTSVPMPTFNDGYTNQEIYEGLVKIKSRVSSLFGGEKKQTYPMNYIA